MQILSVFFVFILGLCIGSFLNVCVFRLPRSESIVSPPSRCTTCGHELKFFDLFPILSFVISKGKCRYCGSPVSLRYLIIETLTGALFAAAFLRYSLGIEFVLFAAFFSLLVVAAFIDIEFEIIPDSVSILGPIPALIIYTALGRPLFPLLGMAMGFLSMWALFRLTGFVLKQEAMGEGDIKLAMMIGAYLGWSVTIVALFLSFVIGAVAGLFLIALKKKKFGQHIPFGPFLALGALVSSFFGELIFAWYVGMLF